MSIGLLVYAKTNQRFEHWAHQNHLSPRNPLLQHVWQPRHTQGRHFGTPILCVDEPPVWLLDEIEARDLHLVARCPVPLLPFEPFDLQDTTSDDHSYTRADIQPRESGEQHVDVDSWQTWAISWLIILFVILLAGYVGFLVGRGGA